MKTSTASHFRRDRGSVLITALVVLAVLAFVSGLVLQVVIPRHNTTYQVAAWQEARLAAEAGIDRAMLDIKANVGDLTKAGSWAGWKTGTSSASATGGAALAVGVARSDASFLAPGFTGNFRATDSIYLDNLDVTPAMPGAPPAVADVELWAIYPDVGDRPNNVWFRVRSMGTASISGGKFWAPVEQMDAVLRRLSIRERRTALVEKDRGTPHTDVAAQPNASRIVEVLARPLFMFDKAILTKGLLATGHSNNYLVDSYNSLYGPYDSDTALENGDIASMGEHVDGDGFLAEPGDEYDIYLGNAEIYGDLETYHYREVDGVLVPSYSGDEDQVTGDTSSGFYRELPMPTPPTPPLGYFWTDVSSPETINSASGAVQYLRTASLGALTVTGTSATRIIIHVTGDWDTGSGNKSEVIIPANVKLEVYVGGDIDFGNGDINEKPDGAVGKPENLQVFGLTQGSTFSASGNPNMSLTFYGPGTDISYKGGGNGAWYGAIVANEYDLRGGGNAGFHYDEALANVGTPIGYSIASYFESTRE